MALTVKDTATPLAPPRRPGRPRKSDSEAQAQAQGQLAKRVEGVNGVFQLAGLACMTTGNLADAAAIGQHGPNVSVELAKIAETNEKVGRIIDRLTDMGPYGALVTALMPLVTQILVNHKVMQPGVMGSVPRETLEEGLKAEIALQHMELLRKQKQMHEEAKQMRQMVEAMQAEDDAIRRAQTQDGSSNSQKQ